MCVSLIPWGCIKCIPYACPNPKKNGYNFYRHSAVDWRSLPCQTEFNTDEYLFSTAILLCSIIANRMICELKFPCCSLEIVRCLVIFCLLFNWLRHEIPSSASPFQVSASGSWIIWSKGLEKCIWCHYDRPTTWRIPEEMSRPYIQLEALGMGRGIVFLDKDSYLGATLTQPGHVMSQ